LFSVACLVRYGLGLFLCGGNLISGYLLLILLGGFVTEVKTIKISKETYAKLCEIAGELQVKLKRPVSMEEAMKSLIKRREKGRKISDLAGTWDITDDEFKEIEAAIDESWKKW
jgi:lipoate-protein ligase A